MTREEVINELDTFKRLAKSESGEKALDMAIGLLAKIPERHGHIAEMKNDRQLGMNVVVDTLFLIQQYCKQEGKNHCTHCPFRLSHKEHKDGECLFHRDEPHNWELNLLDEFWR